MDFLMSPEVLEIAGYIGVGLYLGSYVLLQLGIILGSGSLYSVMNLLAACFVLASLMSAFNMSSAIIQVTWIIISVVGLSRRAILNAMVTYTPEERAFLDDIFPDMPKPIGRRFLDRGTWVLLEPGHEITREGEPVANLCYILDGQAGVLSGGHRVATVARGLIGEMNVQAGAPASATVTVETPIRAFVISRDALLALGRRDSDFRALLEAALSRSVRQKLAESNARAASGAAGAQ